MAGLLLFLEQPLLDDRLGGDPRVVGAGHPEDIHNPASAASESGRLEAYCSAHGPDEGRR